MLKFACPSLILHSSVGSEMNNGGTSVEPGSVLVRARWKDDTEGLAERGGDGGVSTCGVPTGELLEEKLLFRSVMVGDCSKFCKLLLSSFGGAVIKGGSRGVDARRCLSIGSFLSGRWISTGEAGTLMSAATAENAGSF